MISSPVDDPKVLAVAHAKVKVEWAKQHIKGVDQIVKQMASADGYILKPYQDSQTGIYRLYIGPKTGIPINLPLHMGDAIHNLNSVMDYLWSGLARSVNPVLASKVTFPRDETRQNLVARLAASRGYHAAIKQTFPQIDAFVLDMVKPYKGSDGDAIWSLNKLDNISKHRLLIPTTNIIGFKKDLVVVAADGGTIIQKAEAGIITNGPNMSFGFAAPFTFNDDAEPTIGVIFERDDPFGTKPVAETLVNLTQAVVEIIKAFEKAFIGGPVKLKSDTDAAFSVN